VITMDGRTLFHCGDSGLDDFERYRAFGLDRGHIDLAFLHWWGVWDDADSCQTLARELIRPEQIVLMHLIPGREPSAQPEQQEPVARKVVVPQHPMEKWTFR
jgi:L-ascorbate metabolism protein UlaG (beta-lactamase superfamily)